MTSASKSRHTKATIPWNIADPFKQYGCRCQCHATGNEDCSPCCQGKRFHVYESAQRAREEAR